MKNPFGNMKLANLLVALREISLRFPLPLALAFMITWLGIYGIALENTIDSHTLSVILKIMTTCVTTFFLSVSIYILWESYSLSGLQKNLVQIVSVAFGIGFYFTLNRNGFESTESAMSTLLNLAGFVSLLFIAPFLRRIIEGIYSQDAYHGYFYRTSLTFLISSIVGWALMLLGSVAIGSVFNLFDIHVSYASFFSESRIYGYWAMISFAFVSPIFGLVHLPASDSFEEEWVEENKFFNFLVRYIGIPFIYIYFFILYAYSIKVLMNFGDWPKGQISWMVIGFSIFGYLIYIFSYSLEKHDSIRAFRKYFPFAVLPQILMLFYAIYLRIAQYDITIDRYFVVVFGIFLIIISLYYSFSKRKYLGFIPLILGVIVVLISMGPWSVYSLPETRQYDRLVSHLEKAHILKDGDITPLKEYNDIDAELSGEIYDGISYVCDFSECSKVKALFPKEVADAEAKSRKAFEENKDLNSRVKTGIDSERGYPGISKWEIVEAVSSSIKVRRSSSYSTTPEYLYFRMDYNDYFPIALENYQYITSITSPATDKGPGMKPTSKVVSVSVQGENLTIRNGDVTVETLSIKSQMDAIMTKNNGTGDMVLPKKDLTFEVVWERYRLKLFFQSISIRNPKHTASTGESMTYQNTSGYALISER